MSDQLCPKCEAAMERGYLLDEGTNGRVLPARWEAGFPTQRMNWFGRLNRAGKTITAYRCTKCGYLELYAR
ncbi:MAG: PF20097 family protein [Anaerolineae bacterium]|nr:PF20097 family protein [Anaerolineae bacterium]